MSETQEQIEVLTLKAIQKLTAHTTRCLKKISEAQKKYDPRTQLSLRKALIRQLPSKPMRLDIYMGIVDFYLRENDVQLTLAAYELFLYKIGVIQDNKVCSAYNAQLVEQILEII